MISQGAASSAGDWAVVDTNTDTDTDTDTDTEALASPRVAALLQQVQEPQKPALIAEARRIANMVTRNSG